MALLIFWQPVPSNSSSASSIHSSVWNGYSLSHSSSLSLALSCAELRQHRQHWLLDVLLLELVLLDSSLELSWLSQTRYLFGKDHPTQVSLVLCMVLLVWQVLWWVVLSPITWRGAGVSTCELHRSSRLKAMYWQSAKQPSLRSCHYDLYFLLLQPHQKRKEAFRWLEESCYGFRSCRHCHLPAHDHLPPACAPVGR